MSKHGVCTAGNYSWVNATGSSTCSISNANGSTITTKREATLEDGKVEKHSCTVSRTGSFGDPNRKREVHAWEASATSTGEGESSYTYQEEKIPGQQSLSRPQTVPHPGSRKSSRSDTDQNASQKQNFSAVCQKIQEQEESSLAQNADHVYSRTVEAVAVDADLQCVGKLKGVNRMVFQNVDKELTQRLLAQEQLLQTQQLALIGIMQETNGAQTTYPVLATEQVRGEQVGAKDVTNRSYLMRFFPGHIPYINRKHAKE